jgi:basic amino acid/polyamine antiporter, APA family
MIRELLRTKTVDQLSGEAEEGRRLKKALGPIDVTALGVGGIIGAGIFATIGTAAAGDPTRPGAGPALVVSFVITAIACGFAALCYAEFAAMIPISGSAYTYAYATLGELIAWIIGWDLIIEYAVGNVAVAISWGNYFKTLVGGFGIVIPDWLSTDYRTAAKIPGLFENAPHIFGVPIVINALAIAIVALVTVVLVIGIRESANMNTGMVVLKLIVLAFFVTVGFGYVRGANFHPFMPNGWAGVQAGAAIVFFAYIGFDAVSTVAEETRNPRRDLPIGIIGSLIISTIVYIAVAAVFTGIIPYDVLRQKLATEQAEPLTMALQYANIERWGNVFVGVVAFGSVVAHTAVLLVFQMGQPRIFFSMARDGLLPQSFAKVHPRFRTPHVTTILTGVAVGVCAMFTSIDEMVDLTNIGTLFAFILVCIGIIILRVRDPHRPRSFKVPLYPFVPIMGVISCIYLMRGLPAVTWIRFGLWLVVGIVVYMLYGFSRSRLSQRKTL